MLGDKGQDFPRRTSVVVIGGGIIGVSAAYALAERGIPVVLCEKGRLAGEQSSRNWGWVRNQGRDPRELPLTTRSLAIWDQMAARLSEDVGFRRCGILYLARTEAELARHEAWLVHAKVFELDTRIIRGPELDAVLPGAAGRFKGALYTQSDGRAEPDLAVPAIARAAQRLGATILTQCAVRGLETRAGRIALAVTEQGAIECDAVVLAGGAWSRLFCGNLGIDLPQLKLRASVLRTEPLDGGPETSALGDNFAFRKRLDGDYTVAEGINIVAELVPDSVRLFGAFLPALRQQWRQIRLGISGQGWAEATTPRRWALDRPSPFEHSRVLDPAPSERLNRAALAGLAAAFPVFGQARIARQWAGFIDATPDAVPVIGGIDAIPGLTIATGFSGHGFGIGPAAGRLAAELATGATPSVDPTPFRLSRFTDGSPFEFHGL
jgi:glycine/D-amino acid oxidase-like deaminating enzyme